MPILINNIGTTWIGKRGLGPEGSYTTTEWFMFFVPILPFRSLLVRPRGSEFVRRGDTSTFKGQEFLVERVPLCRKQVAMVYGFEAIVLANVLLYIIRRGDVYCWITLALSVAIVAAVAWQITRQGESFN